MTPEEKAKQLVDRFEKALGSNTGIVAAEICVDEVLDTYHSNLNPEVKYWEQVKQYIQLL